MKENKIDFSTGYLARIAEALEKIAKHLEARPIPLGITTGFDGKRDVVFSGFGCTCGNPTTTTGGCPIHGVGPL